MDLYSQYGSTYMWIVYTYIYIYVDMYLAWDLVNLTCSTKTQHGPSLTSAATDGGPVTRRG